MNARVLPSALPGRLPSEVRRLDLPRRGYSESGESDAPGLLEPRLHGLHPPKAEHREARTRPLFQIQRGVEVALDQRATSAPIPLSIREHQLRIVPAAVSAKPGRRKPPIRLLEVGAIPHALVLQLGEEVRHPGISDGLRQPAVLRHPCHVQGFHCHAARRLGYPVASPENVTETLAPGISSHQRHFRQSVGCR